MALAEATVEMPTVTANMLSPDEIEQQLRSFIDPQLILTRPIERIAFASDASDKLKSQSSELVRAKPVWIMSRKFVRAAFDYVIDGAFEKRDGAGDCDQNNRFQSEITAANNEGGSNHGS